MCVVPEPSSFDCETCNKSFPTKRELGVHVKSKHPEVANAAINIERIKRRWTDEETRMLAVDEARLIIQGVDHINQELAALHTDRTIEAIKGKRRLATYKRLVEELVNSTPAPDSQASDADLHEDREGAADSHPRSDTLVEFSEVHPAASLEHESYDQREVEARLREFLGTLPDSVGAFAEVDEVIASMHTLSREAMLARIEAILRRIFPPSQDRPRIAPRSRTKKNNAVPS